MNIYIIYIYNIYIPNDQKQCKYIIKSIKLCAAERGGVALAWGLLLCADTETLVRFIFFCLQMNKSCGAGAPPSLLHTARWENSWRDCIEPQKSTSADVELHGGEEETSFTHGGALLLVEFNNLPHNLK